MDVQEGTSMAMGKRKQRQESLFIAANNLPRSDGHPFYHKLNSLLAEAGFDRWIEARCRPFYEHNETRGKPSMPPGIYFRMLLVGYFEGIDSQRGIAWRCADSLGLRAFLGIPLDEATPDHSTMSVTATAWRGSLRRGVSLRAHDRRREAAAGGQDGGRGQHDAGGQRGDEEHRAATPGEDWRQLEIRAAGARTARSSPTKSRATRNCGVTTKSGKKTVSNGD